MNITKNWILAGFLTVLSILGASAVIDNFEPKKFEQKISLTQDHIATMRGWATLYASLNPPTKDYANINISNVASKNIMQLPVVGSGASSTVVAPFDSEMSFGLSASSSNKKFTISITQSTNTSMDSTQKQQFEDLIKDWAVNIGASVGGYTSSSADGNISITFAG